ncbi:MAG: pyridoxamine 5'-phosphate oxidase family protein [Gammaproteobacteria bacterium]|nr:pyridoxamine 5'-phosphate oxidase family protein [Gammaproteobacteria bacterium]HJP34948.1 pyridoxamine 5'-phosphate oxidase family protein [Gammaproteobacteria bacterium]
MSWRGNKFGALSGEELDEFLRGPWIARLACLKPDGAPYVVPVWYHWDGDAFWVVPRARSEWALYMARDPRVSLVVDEPEPPIRKVLCEGKAVVVEEPVGPILDNGEKSVWNKLGEEHTGPRYLGDKAAEYRGSVNVEPCWTFKIVPEKITTWQGFGWHKRYFHPELHEKDGGGER